MDDYHEKIRRPCEMGYVINQVESNMFGGIWDEDKNQKMVKSYMDTYIHGNIFLVDHEVF